MNHERLDKLIKVIEESQTFSLSEFCLRNVDGVLSNTSKLENLQKGMDECGTLYCIAGYAAVLAVQEQGVKALRFLKEEHSYVAYPETARAYLDLTLEEVDGRSAECDNAYDMVYKSLFAGPNPFAPFKDDKAEALSRLNFLKTHGFFKWDQWLAEVSHNYLAEVDPEYGN